MRAFAALYDALDRARGTNAKIAALAEYLTAVPPEQSYRSCEARR